MAPIKVAEPSAERPPAERLRALDSLQGARADLRRGVRGKTEADTSGVLAPSSLGPGDATRPGTIHPSSCPPIACNALSVRRNRHSRRHAASCPTCATGRLGAYAASPGRTGDRVMRGRAVAPPPVRPILPRAGRAPRSRPLAPLGHRRGRARPAPGASARASPRGAGGYARCRCGPA